MINKPEPIPTWSRFATKFDQKSARQVTLASFLGWNKNISDGVRAKRVLEALKNKQKGGEKI